jgi:transposase
MPPESTLADVLFVAVPADREPEPIRTFPTFTRDLNALAERFQHCGIETVAMESTSVYWIPVHQILESRGFEVRLVNAQHVKNVPGRKTDVSDCQWIQYLHSVGLLRGSFRPPDFICAIRSLWRHRGSLIQMTAEHALHMQKALDHMNLRIHRVLNDFTGTERHAYSRCHYRGRTQRRSIGQVVSFAGEKQRRYSRQVT